MPNADSEYTLVKEHFDRMKIDPAYRDAATWREIESAEEIASKYGMIAGSVDGVSAGENTDILGSTHTETHYRAMQRIEFRKERARASQAMGGRFEEANRIVDRLKSGEGLRAPDTLMNAIKILQGIDGRISKKDLAQRLSDRSASSGATGGGFAQLYKKLGVAEDTGGGGRGYILNDLGKLVAGILLGVPGSESSE